MVVCYRLVNMTAYGEGKAELYLLLFFDFQSFPFIIVVQI
jgi:hypothetical protein